MPLPLCPDLKDILTGSLCFAPGHAQGDLPHCGQGGFQPGSFE
jgi:hypothetical protein